MFLSGPMLTLLIGTAVITQKKDCLSIRLDMVNIHKVFRQTGPNKKRISLKYCYK